MKIWSKGLGRTELVMDFDGYTVERVKQKRNRGAAQAPGQLSLLESGT